MSVTAAREALIRSLNARVTTYQVAGLVKQLNLPFSEPLKRDLNRIIQAGQLQGVGRHDDFDTVDSADTHFTTFTSLFPSVNVNHLQGVTVDDPQYVLLHKDLIFKGMGFLGFGDLSPSEALVQHYLLTWQAGEASSKKAFLKRLRFLNAYQEKLVRIEGMVEFRHAQQQAKSRLTYLIDGSKLDDASLAYVAYLAARANRRSMFVLGAQSKAFDNISEALFKLIPDDADWSQIALTRPTTSVFRRLTAGQLGELTALFYEQMTVAATRLGTLWEALPARMRDEMVMVKGVDSSRWNAYAGAYNTMRAAWVSVVLASGMGDVFDSFMPGKVGRLMASDLVHWSRSGGVGLHQDTTMFAALPKPWEVISGEAKLTREMVLDVAAKAGTRDIEKSGWVTPRRDLELEVVSAEPALVHGIAILNPELVELFYRSGVFSGKQLKAAAVDLADVSFMRVLDETTTGGKVPVVL